MIKDEHLYLDEWINHHLKIGFHEIYLYEDYDSLSHKEITNKYNNVFLFNVKDVGLVKDNPERQKSLYLYFTTKYKDKMDWCAFIDIDEFIILDGITLQSLCDNFFNTEYNAFCLYWKLFNANGHITRPSGGLVESYTKEVSVQLIEAKSMFLYKSIVNMHKDITNWVNPHAPNKTCDTTGQRIDYNPKLNNIVYAYGHINHYFTKSFEDYEQRLQRGNVTKNLRNMKDFFKINKDLETKISQQ